jgi:hypothetical protein
VRYPDELIVAMRIIRATLRGLGFDLVKTQHDYTVIERRAKLDLPIGPLLPTTDASLEEITKLFSPTLRCLGKLG